LGGLPNFDNVYGMSFEDNPLEYPPIEVLRLGYQEVLRYLRQQYSKTHKKVEETANLKTESILYPSGMGEIITWLGEAFQNSPIEGVTFSKLSHTITGTLNVSCKVQLKSKKVISGTLSFRAEDEK
jgi:hypothetical protein